LIFSGNLFKYDLLFKASAGFVTFSLVASVIYILNDIRDLENDRLHTDKRNRPLASGAVSVKNALKLIGFLSVVAVGLTTAVLNHPLIWTFLIIYVLINLAYSFGLKNVSLVDITIIVAGYMLRVAFGGVIIGVSISSWMYLTVMAMSFYLAFGKRRNEMQKNGNTARIVLQHYSVQFLDKMMYISLGLTVMFYSMWCVTPNELLKSERLIWTVPLVLLICMRYSMNVEGDSNGDPAEVLFGDKILLLLAGLYGILLMALFYGSRLLLALI
jgi:4-hydroxybenzoate polyprenyltransferase